MMNIFDNNLDLMKYYHKYYDGFCNANIDSTREMIDTNIKILENNKKLYEKGYPYFDDSDYIYNELLENLCDNSLKLQNKLKKNLDDFCSRDYYFISMFSINYYDYIKSYIIDGKINNNLNSDTIERVYDSNLITSNLCFNQSHKVEFAKEKIYKI